jgi:hypothetical protein
LARCADPLGNSAGCRIEIGPSVEFVPDALHRQLKARAAMSGLPQSDYLIREVRKIAEQPTPDEMRERLQGRDPYRGKKAPTELLRAERDSR